MGNLASAKGITFFDVETTSLDPTKSAILQITITTDWDNGKTECWTTKIKPRDIEIEFASQEALNICGYSPKKWLDAPLFEEVAETIAKKLMWGPLIAHNIQFDVAHITSSLERRGWKKAKSFQNADIKNKIFKFGYPLIDTCALSYLFLPTERQNLDTLREHYELSTFDSHTSEGDVNACRHVFYDIVNRLSGKL